MATKPRYVLDTNVIVSALLFPESIPGQAFVGANKRGELLLSVEVVEEIAEVLRRPKFDRHVLPEERDRFLATLIRQAKLIAPKYVFVNVVIQTTTSGWNSRLVAMSPV